MKYIISVGKTYKHRGQLWHKPSTKKYWHIYYHDEDFRFHWEQVSYLQAMYYKTKKLHKLHYICTECGYYFLALVKSAKETVDCPKCND